MDAHNWCWGQPKRRQAHVGCEAIDGIYIFAAICIGLASGIGYLGIATIMALFFCITNAILWQLDYGRNPIDDARQEKKQAKLENISG